MQIPCIVYVTSNTWTQNLQKLWTDNLKNSFCTLRFFDDFALLKSSSELNIKDYVDKISPWAYKSDLWRYAVVLNTGGIFFDAELKIFRPPEKIFNLNRDSLQIVKDRPPNHCAYNAAFASPANNSALRNILQRTLHNIKRRSYGFEDSDQEPWLGITGPCTMAKALQNETFITRGYYDGVHIRCKRNICAKNAQAIKNEFKSKHYGEIWGKKNVYHELT